MQLRGILVDEARRVAVIEEYYEKDRSATDQLEQIVLDGVGMPTFSWRSNPDCNDSSTASSNPTIKKQAAYHGPQGLEKMQLYLVARPIVSPPHHA